MFKRILVLFVVLCWPLPVFAAHPLITDDAGTQGKGNFLFEFNGEHGHKNKDNVLEDCTEMAAALTYGINDHIDVSVGIPYRLIRREDSGTTTENGISDTALALKWRFYEKNDLSFAVKPGVTLPSGSDERCLGSGRVTYSMFFITTKEIAPCAIHLNFGYKRNENKIEERKDLWHASLASEIKMIKDLKVVANVGMERNPDRSSSIDPSFILGGIIYSIRENLDIDLGVKGWLNNLDTDYSVLAGLSLRF
ncbi:MAG: transporter [Syntrophaceae bacterium]|nr:transporter [Syntrophaceae bacterium]